MKNCIQTLTMMYRFTKDQRYLAQANGIAKFILQHPHLPADKVPYWDFEAQRRVHSA